MCLKGLTLAFLLTLTYLGVVGPFVVGSGVEAQTLPTATATATATTEPAGTGDEELGVGLFAWAFEDGGFSGNYLRGLVLYLLGTVGALVAVYSTLGDFLPSMGRGAYDIEQAAADEHRRTRDELLEARKGYVERRQDPPADLVALSTNYVQLVAQGDGALARHRWRFIAMAVPLCVLLGGFVATAIASSLTLALAVGFGWTAVLDRIGLGRQLAKTTPERTEAVDRLSGAIRDSRLEVAALIGENQRLTAHQDALSVQYNELVDLYQQARDALQGLAKASEDVSRADDGDGIPG